LWRLLTGTLLDRRSLSGDLAASVSEHESAHRLRRDRLTALDAVEALASVMRQAKEIEEGPEGPRDRIGRRDQGE
jgi:hypothetical protein